MEQSFYNYEASAQGMPDTSETIQISALSLLKMMKHGRAGIPLEVMGLMLGEFIDEYSVRVVDVFAMPQSGTGVSVEAVDPVFQASMMDTLKQTGRHEMVVGWYHSHPGFGCWLSTVDVSTQAAFEMMCKRAVAVVVDPIQSVKGKVVIDAFRNINNGALGGEARITTSNIGFLKQPTFISLVHGLNKNYYSFNITFAKDEQEKNMLLNMNRRNWNEMLRIRDANRVEMGGSIKDYIRMIRDEKKYEGKELEMHRIGKMDHRRIIKEKYHVAINEMVIRSLLRGIHSYVFSEQLN